MPSTYTSSNRFEKPGQFEQDSTWGLTANVDFDLIDTAISGFVSIGLADTNYSLTVANGATDQARRMTVFFTGALTATRTITIPAVAKIYIMANLTNQPLVITTGSGGTVTLAAINTRFSLLVCNGTDVYVVASNTTDAATLNGQAAAFYQNANNLNAGTVPLARLSAGTTGALGILQLTDSVASTSTTTAATPNSVKTANDAAVAAQSSATAAVNTANAASTNATAAVNTANTAQGTANSASSAANTAQTTANNAVSAAGTAQTAANAAQTTANAAVMHASRAWVNFNGVTGVIAAAFNVTSITKNGTGDYTVNFTVAMANANYAMSGSSGYSSNIGVWTNPNRIATATPFTVSTARVGTSVSGFSVDPEIVSLVFFGS